MKFSRKRRLEVAPKTDMTDNRIVAGGACKCTKGVVHFRPFGITRDLRCVYLKVDHITDA